MLARRLLAIVRVVKILDLRMPRDDGATPRTGFLTTLLPVAENFRVAGKRLGGPMRSFDRLSELARLLRNGERAGDVCFPLLPLRYDALLPPLALLP